MWFKRKGLDKNFARKQKWWSDISKMIDTDDETKHEIVNYIFYELCNAKITELDWLAGMITSQQPTVNIQIDLLARKSTLENYIKNPPKDAK